MEIGLASGISTLFILEAMKKNGGRKLIGMDPSQFKEHKDRSTTAVGSTYEGRGLYAVKSAGYSKMYEFYNQSSQLVLPELVKKKVAIDFAFIDGWHTFDHTLVDFFYIDQLLNVGGVVAFHDTNWPSIRLVCKFIETNKKYKRYPIPPKWDTDRVTAYVKVGSDDRNFDHFVHFCCLSWKQLFRIKLKAWWKK